MRVVWTDEFTLYLIDKVQAAEYIWNPRCNTYKNKQKKKDFWSSLSEELNSCFVPNVPFEYGEVIRKWNNLKSYFTAEKQKILRAQESGAGVEDIEAISSAWKFQKKLNFLSSTLIPTPAANNFNKSLNFLQSSSSSAIETDFSDSPPATTPTPSSLRKASPTLSIKIESVSPNQFQESELTMSSVALSPPLPSPTTFTPQLQLSTITPNHPNKKAKVMTENHILAASLIKKSNELSEAITRGLNCNLGDSSDNASFGNCIVSEISKLDEDLKLEGKRRIFNIIWELQAEQLQRKSNGLPTDHGY